MIAIRTRRRSAEHNKRHNLFTHYFTAIVVFSFSICACRPWADRGDAVRWTVCTPTDLKTEQLFTLESRCTVKPRPLGQNARPLWTFRPIVGTHSADLTNLLTKITFCIHQNALKNQLTYSNVEFQKNPGVTSPNARFNWRGSGLKQRGGSERKEEIGGMGRRIYTGRLKS